MIPCVKYTLKKNKLDKPKHKNDIKIREMFKLPSDWLFLLICFMIGGGGGVEYVHLIFILEIPCIGFLIL